MSRTSLRRHEALGLSYRWPPTAGDAHQASLAPHPLAELLRILSQDALGAPVWASYEDLCQDLSSADVRLWAAESGAEGHFDEAEVDDDDLRRQKKAQELRGGSGLPDQREIRDVKAWSSLSEFERMVAQLSLAYHLDPLNLMKLDYKFVRGMLAKASMDQREQAKEQRRKSYCRPTTST